MKSEATAAVDAAITSTEYGPDQWSLAEVARLASKLRVTPSIIIDRLARQSFDAAK